MSCIRLDVSFGVGLVSYFIEKFFEVYMKMAKRIFRYIEGTLDYGMFYLSSKEFNSMGYCDSDFAEDLVDQKSTTGFSFSWEIMLSLG